MLIKIGFPLFKLDELSNKKISLRSNILYISNTRNNVSSDIHTPRSGLKNEVQPSFFKPTSRCLDTRLNTLSSV